MDPMPLRIFCDFEIQPDDYIRVHYTPRLYPIAKRTASFWMERVVFECEHFLIINKPAGIPSNPTVDNFYENILQVYCDVYGRQEKENDDGSGPPLFLPQRLDTDTSGLLLMARTKIFAGYFGQLLKDRATSTLKKRYRALVASEDGGDDDGSGLLSPGTLRGRISRRQVTPRVFVRADPLGGDTQTDTTADWQYCETTIVHSSSRIAMTVAEWMEWIDRQTEAEELPLRTAVCEWFARHQGSPGVRIALQEVELELVTGRTHQIRGQLQALQRDSGGPSTGVAQAAALHRIHLAGDNLYTGCTSKSSEPVKMSPHLALQVCVSVCVLHWQRVTLSCARRQACRLEFADPISALQPAAEGGRQDKKFAQVKRRVRQAMRSVPPQTLQKTYCLRDVWWMPLHKLLYPLTRR